MSTSTNSLSSWIELNKSLQLISEKECWKLLDTEKKGQRRTNFLLRIHGRANKLRAERERRELIGG